MQFASLVQSGDSPEPPLALPAALAGAALPAAARRRHYQGCKKCKHIHILILKLKMILVVVVHHLRLNFQGKVLRKLYLHSCLGTGFFLNYKFLKT